MASSSAILPGPMRSPLVKSRRMLKRVSAMDALRACDDGDQTTANSRPSSRGLALQRGRQSPRRKQCTDTLLISCHQFSHLLTLQRNERFIAILKADQRRLDLVRTATDI